MNSSSNNHVAVLGGGISGLVSAYRLLQKGSRVTLFEASDELGGLGAWGEWNVGNWCDDVQRKWIEQDI